MEIKIEQVCSNVKALKKCYQINIGQLKFFVSFIINLQMQGYIIKNILKQNQSNEQNLNSQELQRVKILNTQELCNFDINNQRIQVEEEKNGLEPKIKQRTRIKAENWNYVEIKKIFKLYSQYGSQWKIMETQFIDRAANSIKNRFYTVIRTLLKLLFRQHPSIKQKLPHQIPSKIILKFYEGRQEFNKYKGFGKRILKLIDFNLESKEIKKIVQDNEAEIMGLYEIIFELKCSSQENSSGYKGTTKKSKGQMKQKNKDYQVERQSPQRSQYMESGKNRSQTCIWPQDQLNFNYNNQIDGSGVIFFVPINYFEPPQVQPYFQFL